MAAANHQTKARASNPLYRNHLKRVLDVSFAGLLLVPSVPIICLAVIFIKSDSTGPAFFSQRRIGKDCREFSVYKLRTMTLTTHDINGRKLEENERITGVGRLIRKLSIDELPQLVNILKGEMSFIGPRPLLVRYLPHYTEEENRRHDVLPGITGLAQINGRRNLDWPKRFAYDVEYVDNVSFYLDLQIVFKTVKKVFKGDDTLAVSSQELPDLDEYRGYNRYR